MNSQTVAERIDGTPGTWADMPLYAQMARVQGLLIKDVSREEETLFPGLAERLRGGTGAKAPRTPRSER